MQARHALRIDTSMHTHIHRQIHAYIYRYMRSCPLAFAHAVKGSEGGVSLERQGGPAGIVGSTLGVDRPCACCPQMHASNVDLLVVVVVVVVVDC